MLNLPPLRLPSSLTHYVNLTHSALNFTLPTLPPLPEKLTLISNPYFESFHNCTVSIDTFTQTHLDALIANFQALVHRLELFSAPLIAFLHTLNAFYVYHKPTLIFTFYHLSLFLITLRFIFTLYPRLRSSPAWRPALLFTFLTILALVTTWSHILLYYYSSYAAHRENVITSALNSFIPGRKVQSLRSMLSMAEWLRGTKLFAETWGAVVSVQERWWWTQQLLFVCAAWAAWVAGERGVRGRWRKVGVMVVAQFVGVSVGAGLAVLEVLASLGDEEKKRVNGKKVEERLTDLDDESSLVSSIFEPRIVSLPASSTSSSVSRKSSLKSKSTTSTPVSSTILPPQRSKSVTSSPTASVILPPKRRSLPRRPSSPRKPAAPEAWLRYIYTPLYTLTTLASYRLPSTLTPETTSITPFLTLLLLTHALLFIPLLFPPPSSHFLRRLQTALWLAAGAGHVKFTAGLGMKYLDVANGDIVKAVGTMARKLAEVLLIVPISWWRGEAVERGAYAGASVACDVVCTVGIVGMWGLVRTGLRVERREAEMVEARMGGGRRMGGYLARGVSGAGGMVAGMLGGDTEMVKEVKEVVKKVKVEKRVRVVSAEASVSGRKGEAREDVVRIGLRG